jgi:hypothetical protein
MINPNSRYRRGLTFIDLDNYIYQPLIEGDDYDPRDDDINHIVVDGETLFSIAHLYYKNIPGGVHNWWIIAEYQPVPVIDPTRKLQPRSIVIVPSPQHAMEIQNGTTTSATSEATL